MKIGVGKKIWIVIDNDGNAKAVFNSLYHAEKYAKTLKLDINKNIKESQYVGGI